MPETEYRTLYLRVTENMHDQVTREAKRRGLSLGKYISFCVSKYGDSIQIKEAPPPKTKVLFCRIAESEYELIKQKAEENNMKMSEYIKRNLSKANGEDIDVSLYDNIEDRSKVIYCKVSKEIHSYILQQCSKLDMTISQYVVSCFKKKNEFEPED